MSKNKRVKLEVNWPTEDEFWTVSDLLEKNPHFKEITLRVRLSTAINNKKTIAVIGEQKVPIGRPKMVCVVKQSDGSVKQSTIEKARDAEVMVFDKYPSAKVNLNPVEEESVISV